MTEELEPIEKAKNPLQIFYLPSNSGEVHRYYRKSEADKVIANKDAEISRLKRALYKACANWADCEAGRLFWEEDMKKAEKFDKMVDKCRAKAEEYK